MFSGSRASRAWLSWSWSLAWSLAITSIPK
jgi:hypothetical protein